MASKVSQGELDRRSKTELIDEIADLRQQVASLQRTQSQADPESEGVRAAIAERLDLALQATDTAIWDWDIEKKLMWNSRGIGRLSGRGDVEFTQHFDLDDDANPWVQRLHPDDRDAVVHSVRDHLEKDTPLEAEYRYRAGDDQYVWLRSVGRVIRAPDGRPIRMVGSDSDITARKEAEAVLRERDARHATVAELSQDLIWIFTDGVIVDCNKYAADALGLETREELIGTSVLSLIHSEDHEFAQKRFAQLQQGMETPAREVRLLRRDGTVITVETKACPYSFRGKPSVLAIARDVSDTKRREQLLRDSEVRFRAIFEGAAVGIAIASLDGHVIRCNSALTTMMGYTAGELDGVPWSDYTHPDDNAENKILSDQVARGERSNFRMEKRFLRRDGDVVWARLTVSVVGDEVESPLFRVAMIEDITERKRVEEALQGSEERFRGLIENSPAAIFLKDLDGRFQLVNSKFEDWYGVSSAKVIGKSSHDIYPEEFADKYAAQDREVIATQATCEREATIPFLDGTEHKIVITKFPVWDGSGEIVGIGTINSDVTAHRDAEEKLRQAQKMEAVGQLTGGIAHDFNNLLTVILGNLEIIECVMAAGGRERDMVARSIRAAERGAELTDRLLAFSRKQTLLPQITKLDELVASMTDMLDRTLGEIVELRIARPHETLWPCYVDASQLENALLNMSINARDAMPHGGCLKIETENVQFDGAQEGAPTELEAGQYVRLAVSDTGYGMSGEILERVFEPFFTTKEVGKGTGLGLSMVYGFARQSGGDVQIFSELGRGTSVNLYLPRAPVTGETP